MSINIVNSKEVLPAGIICCKQKNLGVSFFEDNWRKDTFLNGKIDQIEFVQHANMGGTYIRCFYYKDGKIGQSTPFMTFYPKFDNNGKFIEFKGDNQYISYLKENYNVYLEDDYILVYVKK